MPKRILHISRTQPARTILFIVGLITLIAGLWLFTPWYVAAGTAPAVAKAFSWPVMAAAVVNTLAAVPALWACWKNTSTHLARGAFYMFIWYLFVTVSRVVLGNPATLTWVTTLIIALVMAVVFIEQSGERRLDEQ